MSYTILEQVKIRLGCFTLSGTTPVFTETKEDILLEQLIEQATADVKAARHYPASYDEETIESDLADYESVIVNLTIYDRSQAGEAYMSTYNEGDIDRTWVERNKLLAGVYPIARKT